MAVEYPIIPHAQWGDRECCGCLVVVKRGELSELVCNECSAVVRTVPTSYLSSLVAEMELAGGLAQEVCPHCRSVNLFPGFSKMKAYMCKGCGKGVDLNPQTNPQSLTE